MKRLGNILRFVFVHFVTWRRVLLAALLVAVFVFLALIVVVVATAGDPVPDKLAREAENTQKNIVNDVTELNPVETLGIIVPHTEEEIVAAVKSHDRVSIGGGRNSMGGQTASERAVQIDMREYNKILDLATSTKEITVQSGIRWRDIQEHIDPLGLSVQIMQTYSNFTVGGSLSVNVHGRYVGLGPIILSVKKFRIVLADGAVVVASPTENQDIFYSAIGGMGGMGVITDVTLGLADNVNVERKRVKLSTGEYWEYFRDNVRQDSAALFHNGDMYPPDFESVSAVTWSVTDKEPSTAHRLIPTRQDYWKERAAWVVMSEWPFGRWIREHILDPYLYVGTQPVHTRNYEASYDVAELEPNDRNKSTYVLQEYFVPVEHFDEWVPKMKKVFTDNDVNVLNVSIRHAFPDSGAVLAWAPKESFAFVVYYKQGTEPEDIEEVKKWTQQMIDAVLSVEGTYYLPYQLHATNDQLHRAYPRMVEYFERKKQFDPTNKFTNKLWDTYYNEETLLHYKERSDIRTTVASVDDYYRPLDNAYLTLPEWYIVYSADEYATVLRDGLPSEFPYFTAHKDYWRQHEEALALVADSSHDNSDYLTVLSVIGWSFSIENFVKGAYENTMGRWSEWVAGGSQVAEDQYAAKVAAEYAAFIYDRPWYEFEFWPAFKGIWTLENERDHTFRECLRRLERKIFLSFEYGFKSLYAAVITRATQSEFGVQDDTVSAVITRDGVTREVVGAAHYQPFTRMLIEELARERDNPAFGVLDIAGNERITLTYRDEVGSVAVPETKEVMRDREISGMEGGGYAYHDRITIEVAVRDLARVYQILTADRVSIDHIYDY